MKNYLNQMFGPTTLALQERAGSREGYARMTLGATGEPDALGEAESAFIAARDSFYIASTSEDGWPYVQHRGGPPGFLHVLDLHTLAFADFAGNRQYLSSAHILRDDRVSLFLMDYPARRRLKIIGRAEVVDAQDDPALISRLATPGYRGRAECAFVIDVVGLDWNCPQHITPRWTEAELQVQLAPLMTELTALRAELAHLKESREWPKS